MRGHMRVPNISAVTILCIVCTSHHTNIPGTVLCITIYSNSLQAKTVHLPININGQNLRAFLLVQPPGLPSGVSLMSLTARAAAENCQFLAVTTAPNLQHMVDRDLLYLVDDMIQQGTQGMAGLTFFSISRAGISRGSREVPPHYELKREFDDIGEYRTCNRDGSWIAHNFTGVRQ